MTFNLSKNTKNSCSYLPALRLIYGLAIYYKGWAGGNGGGGVDRKKDTGFMSGS